MPAPEHSSTAPLTLRPLTPDLWPALVDLFGTQGPAQRCWCLYWRIGNAYRQRPKASNQADFQHIVEQGPPPGLLAFAGETAVGWCQITPRAALSKLEHDRRLAQLKEGPVWAISCFYIRKGFRRRGVTTALILAALDHARRAGAPAVEAYPLDADLSPSATHTGYVTTFTRLGFETVAMASPSRPIMRFAFR